MQTITIATDRVCSKVAKNMLEQLFVVHTTMCIHYLTEIVMKCILYIYKICTEKYKYMYVHLFHWENILSLP